MSTFALALLSVGDRNHGDLELRLGRARHRADSYYLSLDPFVQPALESRSKTRRVLAKILTTTARNLRAAKAGAVLCLPYDFSDQYVGLLRLALQAEDLVAMTRMTSTIAGWQIGPSRAAEIAADAWPGLTPWPFGPKDAALPRAELVACLKQSAANALRYVSASRGP